MWINARLGGLVTWLKARLAYSSLVRSRKTTIIFLITLVLFLIWSASKYLPRRGRLKGHPHSNTKYTALQFDEVCLANLIGKWSHDLDHGEVIITHNPIKSHESPYIPFVGNGNVSVAARKDALLHIKGRALMEVPYAPLLVPQIPEAPSPKEATVIDLKHGLVHQIQSYLWGHSCVLVESVVFAHRSYPSLLVQEISLTNHGHSAAKVTFQHDGAKDWRKALTKELSLENRSGGIHYSVHMGTIGYVDDAHPGVNVTIATNKAPSTMTINGRSSTELRHMTVVHSSVNAVDPTPSPIKMELLENQVKEDFIKLMNSVDHKNLPLRDTHVNVWKELWQTGVHVNAHHDADTPPGVEVNATMYYIMSMFPAPDYDTSGKLQNTESIEQLLHTPEHCFSGPPSMHSASLWPIPRTEAAINRMTSSWQRVLQQNGCSSLLQAGATGVVQAMTLSFGGLQFSSGLFEFAANPASLHTSVSFRHIRLHRGAFVNVSVLINEHTGHAEKLVVKARGSTNTPLYACEAGCQYEPVELSASSVVFPVRMTKPVTPILYISRNKSQLMNIKQQVFIKDAHQESLRHHHVYHHVGLPAKFWVTIAFLIVAFHLYLVKLIYTECFKEPIKSRAYLS